jgi:hypothetical protein
MRLAFPQLPVASCAAFVLLGTAPLLHAKDALDPYLITKLALYVQTSSSGPVASIKYPYSFTAQAPASATLELPGLGSTALPYSTNDGDYEIDESFVTKTGTSGLDTAFPVGIYNMTGSGIPTLSFPLSPDRYSVAIPAVTNGTWANNVLMINPSAAYTMDFSNFSDYGNTGLGGYMQLSISDISNSNPSLKQTQVSIANSLGLPQASAPFLSYAIPSGTLNPGDIYEVRLDFGNVTGFDTSSIPGNLAVSIFQNELLFFVVAQTGATSSPPVIASDLTNQTGYTGGTATFSPSVTVGGSTAGNGTITLWYVNGQQINLDGVKYISNGEGLEITGLASSDAGTYFAKFLNSEGMVTSASATLTVNAAQLPAITTQPSSVTAIGGTVVFNVTATGGGLSYQWKFNGANLPGDSTTSRLILTGVSSASAGSYTCVVSNGAGAVTSAAATLTVPAQSANLNGRLINESVESVVPTGTTLTVGFVVGGAGTSSTQTLPLLIRGDGPALAGFGLSGTMPDPAIKVIPLGSQTALLSNDNWGSNLAAVTAADTATGAFALSAGSLDAALTAALTGGGYSVQLTPNGPGGTALAEIFDDIPAGTYQVTAPRIVNLSALTALPAGGTLSAGFFLGGSTSRTVLVRAMGPTLAGLGLSGVMADPLLTLTTSNGTFVVGDEGWGGDPTLASIAVQVGGFAFASSSSLDSAVLVTLSPGTGYTASATSASGAGGEVLIEIYEVP